MTTGSAARQHWRSRDEVDEMIEALVSDPSRAEDIKALLKRKIAAPAPAGAVPPGRAQVLAFGDEGEDDPWDNVPV